MQVNHNWFLGYTKDEEGHLIIDPEQAEVVKRIYRDYLSGQSLISIKRSLEADGILNGAGRAKWNESNIKQILTNEKHIGDAVLQKTCTVDILERSVKPIRVRFLNTMLRIATKALFPKISSLRCKRKLQDTQTSPKPLHSTKESTVAGTNYQGWYSAHIAEIYSAESNGIIGDTDLRFGAA